MPLVYLILIITVIPSYIPVPPDSCRSLANISWMLGEWISYGESDYTIEVWLKVSEITFEGYARTISADDSVEKNVEMLRMVEMSGQVFFIAKVRHNALPVSFALTYCSDTTAVFENPGHDFPTQIIYRLTDSDHISVTVGSDTERFRIDYQRLRER